jgi:DNA-binding NtrC family response regulator
MEGGRVGHYRTLIVDDEADFREITIKQLTTRGIECEEAADGLAAIDKMKNGGFDVVLLDVKMPKMDGIATLQRIKKLAPMTEVVILTGHASVDSGVKSIRFGAFDYLMKPIGFEPLLAKLNAAYESKRSQQGEIGMARVMKNMTGSF